VVLTTKHKIMDAILTGYINLKDTNNYQLIYATKDITYKSFYCVYAKLVISSTGKLEEIKLRLKNYSSYFKHQFEISNDDVFEYQNGILRIACKTKVKAIINEVSDYTDKDLTSLQINVSELKGVFFTRYQEYFNKIINCNTSKLIFFTKQLGAEEARPDIKTKKDFLEENLEVEAVYAVGRNCRVSLTRTENWED
jgi:hypothetical protein